MRWIALVVDLLAVYRLTRLVVVDTILDPIRTRIIVTKNGDMREWWESLLTCRYCVGVWVGFGVMAARWCADDVWTPVAYALAISCAGPLIARLEDD